MAEFPKLKTGAVGQYPLIRESAYGTEKLRFLDGSEQRYRLSGALKRWVIRLELVDEQEFREIEDFFSANQGRFGSFAFVDPADGTEYADCSFDQDALQFEENEEARGSITVIVRQNR
jgi:hypothetical protein